MSNGVIIHVSHDDLDGIGSLVVGSLVAKSSSMDFLPVYSSIQDVDKNIAAALKKHREETRGRSLLFITDICPKDPKLIESIDKNPTGILLVDHHASSLEVLKGRGWAYVSTKACATKLLQELMRVEASEAQEFADVVDDYDRWVHKDPRSKRLNKLLDALGKDEFLDRFSKDLSLEESETDKKLIDTMIRIQNEKVDEAVKNSFTTKDAKGRKVAIIFTDDYASEVADRILKSKDVDYVLILNLKRAMASLRSRGEFDVAAIAKEFGGGGHKNSSGFPLDKDKIAEFARMVLGA